MKLDLQIRGWLILAMLSIVLPVWGQVEVGENVKLSLSGDLSTGYTGTFGDSQGSSHGLSFGGSGSLQGSFYSPQFISFDVQPYYNRAQDNSSFQSITNSNGVVASANIFGGSHYPGSISFSRTSNGTGQFGLPGVTGLQTSGSENSFGINWSAFHPGLPTLNASYMLSGDSSSILGSNSTTDSSSKNLNLHSDYLIKGFMMSGFYIRQSNDRTVPEFLVGGYQEPASNGDSSNSSVGFMTSHAIPLKGYWTANVTHSAFSNESTTGGSKGLGDGSSNAYASSVSVSPFKNFGVSFGAGYQSNVYGALQQQLSQAGVYVPLLNADNSGTALNLRASADYLAFRNLHFNGQVNHTTVTLDGKTIGVTQFGGGVSTTYAKQFLGSITISAGAIDTATEEGNSGAGLYGNVGFSRRLGRWEASADADYSQQIQTLGSIYTTSTYGYGGNLKRKFGDRLYWMNSARETHSGIAQHSGNDSHSESYLSSILYGKISLNGVYSRSGGTAVLTSQGLIAVPGGIPIPELVAPVLFNASSYGGGLSGTYKRFDLSVNYSRAFSDTTAAISSNNNMSQWNSLLRFRMRKLYFNAGFTKFSQSVSAAGARPSVINSFYFGISRWFNVF